VNIYRLIASAIIFATTVTGFAHAAQLSATSVPRALEIELAKSSLPGHLRDQATIYVLNPATGFEVVQKGTNGFHAFVSRTGDDSFRGSWPLKAYRDDILYPISFDDAGSKENMRVFFDAAQMQAAGMPSQKLKELIQERYKTHYYKPPQRAGVSYMMSPILRTYVNPDQGEDVATDSVPHVMHYVPDVSPQDVGADKPTPDEFNHFMMHGRWKDNPDPIVISPGPHGYMVQFLGVTERERLDKEYAPMLARLCELKKVWCIPK